VVHNHISYQFTVISYDNKIKHNIKIWLWEGLSGCLVVKPKILDVHFFMYGCLVSLKNGVQALIYNIINYHFYSVRTHCLGVSDESGPRDLRVWLVTTNFTYYFYATHFHFSTYWSLFTRLVLCGCSRWEYRPQIQHPPPSVKTAEGIQNGRREDTWKSTDGVCRSAVCSSLTAHARFPGHQQRNGIARSRTCETLRLLQIWNDIEYAASAVPPTTLYTNTSRWRRPHCCRTVRTRRVSDGWAGNMVFSLYIRETGRENVVGMTGHHSPVPYDNTYQLPYYKNLHLLRHLVSLTLPSFIVSSPVLYIFSKGHFATFFINTFCFVLIFILLFCHHCLFFC